MRSKEGFSYWVDGRRTWELGIAGFFTRLRAYLASSVFVGLPLAGVPFWWPDSLSGAVTVSPVSIVLGLSSLLFVSFTLLFFYTRSRTQRSLEIKSKLHQLLGEANDSLQALYQRNSQIRQNNADSAVHEGDHISAATKRLAEVIGQYFSTLTGDETVGAIIRLATATVSDTGPSSTVYATFGRSGALNKDRGTSSEPTPGDKGFAKFFIESSAGCKGVLFIDDITKATAKDVYFRTKNDDFYKEDFKTLAVIPINGWNGTKGDLIGLLAITSRTGRILQPRHVDLMKFTGEVLGVFYSSFFAKLLVTGSLPTPLNGSAAR
jgi:hypothetical protein